MTREGKPAPLGKRCLCLAKLQKSKKAEIDRIKRLKRFGNSCQASLLEARAQSGSASAGNGNHSSSHPNEKGGCTAKCLVLALEGEVVTTL